MYSNSLTSFYPYNNNNTKPPPLEPTDSSTPSRISIPSTPPLKPEKLLPTQAFISSEPLISEDFLNPYLLTCVPSYTLPTYKPSLGLAPAEKAVNEFELYLSTSYSPKFADLEEKALPCASAAPELPAVFSPANDYTGHDALMAELLADSSSISAASSSLSTPVLDDSSTSSAVGSMDMVAAGLDLDSLLAAPMYDDEEADAAFWTPLFSASPVDSVAPAAVAAVAPAAVSPVAGGEKRSAQAMDDDDVEEDSKAALRARNTAAARRSRDKKRKRLDDLEARVAELERINTQLSVENQILRTMKAMPPRK